MFKILIIILIVKFSISFINFIKYKKNKYIHHKRNSLVKTFIPEDDNRKNIIDETIDEPIYTLIWYDCKECTELIKNINLLKFKIIYVKGIYYNYETSYNYNLASNPLLYKNDILICYNLFDIYEEIYKHQNQN
jgi:hypothetical protein